MKDNNCDAISFMPSSESLDDTVLQGLTYREPGDKIGGSTMGDSYDIITFRQFNGEFGDMEHFEAILVCPYTYSEKMMKEGYFGFIAKKTTTSAEMVNNIVLQINNLIGISNAEV